MIRKRKESKKIKDNSFFPSLQEEQGISLIEIIEQQAPIVISEDLTKKFEAKKEEMKKKYNVVE